MYNAITVKIARRSNGAVVVKVTDTEHKASYSFDYSLDLSSIPLYYTRKFLSAVYSNADEITDDMINVGLLKDGYVAVINQAFLPIK